MTEVKKTEWSGFDWKVGSYINIVTIHYQKCDNDLYEIRINQHFTSSTAA